MVRSSCFWFKYQLLYQKSDAIEKNQASHWQLGVGFSLHNLLAIIATF
jgi:hypothetical protein